MQLADAAGRRPPTPVAPARAPWRAVAMPAEHGGWGLTLEPVLLGLAVAPSLAGLAIGLAAFVAFLVRTPLKLALVDRRRGRTLARDRLAARIAAGELLVLAALVAAAVAGTAGDVRWLVPVALAVPLVAVQLGYEVRSRGRRLVPELCGAVGIGAAAPAIVLAGGRGVSLAIGVALIVAARPVGAVPFVRAQIMRLRRATADAAHAVGAPATASRTTGSDVAQAISVVGGAVASIVDRRLLAGTAFLVLLAGTQLVLVRRAPIPAKVLGLRQMAMGVALVAVTAAGYALA